MPRCLRRLASAKLRAEGPEHALEPTAVVHEAYLWLKRTGKRWEREGISEICRASATARPGRLSPQAAAEIKGSRSLPGDGVGVADRQRLDADVLTIDEILGRVEQ